MADASEPTESHQDLVRRKSRRACEPCRRQKRRCDGQQPCYSCMRYDYQCYFDEGSRKRALPPSGKDQDESSEKMVRLKSSSSAISKISPPNPLAKSSHARAQRPPVPTGSELAQRLEDLFSDARENIGHPPTRYPAWNLGLRHTTTIDRSLIHLITREEAEKYADVYFDKIHPIYCFVDRGRLLQKVNSRWSGAPSDEYDAVIGVVVALGSLFSGSQALSNEFEVLELSKTILDLWNPVQMTSASSLDSATAYLLRVLYLRMAKDPHTAWVASRVAIAAIQGNVDRNKDTSDETLSCPGYEACRSAAERGLHSRLHWTATALHTWISNEYNPLCQSKDLIVIPCPPPNESGSDEHLQLFISIFFVSLRISNVGHLSSLEELTETFESIGALFHPNVHDALQLHLSNHGLCIYRFMRHTNSVIPASTISSIISQGKPGLAAALRLAQDSQPWWHVIHLPFQFLCVLLAIDTRESLVEIEGVMTTLRAIGQCFVGQTKQMQEMIKMAEHLVQMCQRSKAEAADVLARCNPTPATLAVPSATGAPAMPSGEIGANLGPPNPAEAGFDSFTLDLEVFDWDTWLS